MKKKRIKKHPQWFIDWQKWFYNSKTWDKKRKEILIDRGMISDYSGKLITGKAVVDHIIEITPDNYLDYDIILGNDNLQLLSFSEHNSKTFSNYRPKYEGDIHIDSLDFENRKDSIF